MSISRSIRRSAHAVALMAVFGAAPLAAQDTTTADVLTARAEALYTSLTRYREAAELHEQAASLRATNDPARMRDLLMAGRLFTYAGDPGEGRRTTEEAAQAALANGDFTTAGNFYVDAAFMAKYAQDADNARRLLRAAQWIAEAPTLASPDQRHLRRRMSGDRVVAQS